ncbi:ArsR/SmtB family transcription factor [Ruegeria arenilitoris]|uniref:ArsR/SmtB family transcription factor n=1 Tax=Ruegeria arenilitoris TaxID=1173585 RepID=UPI0020C513F1|nr:metalloregulator ArsR/SmtB family transcription factor [Ruegeria arenilitoris]
MKSDLSKNALEATDFLKTMAHDGRLQILCLLLGGEKSVGEIQDTLSIRQAAASQQLTRLRLSGLVDTRREGKCIYYRVTDARVLAVVELLYDLFCSEDAAK